MRIIKQVTILIIITIVFSVSGLGCKGAAENQSHETAIFTSFRDIPDVTNAEIAAIEALQKKYDSFTYGMSLTTEAFLKENGKVGGYAALVCEWLTDLFGIRFTPGIFPADETISKLNTHEIEFSGNFRITGERTENYYMTDAISERRYILVRRPGSRSIAQILQERPLRYAFMEGFTTPEAAELVASTVNCEILWTKDYAEAYSLLTRGVADAFIGVNVSEVSFDSYGPVSIETFFPLLFSAAAIATANPELEPVISVVNKAIRNGGRAYLGHLYNMGNHEYTNHKFVKSLTAEEREYIKNHPVVPFVANYDNYPVCFYNTHQNEWQGIFFDLLDKISPLTGMSFNIINEDNADWPLVYEKVKSGEAALIAALLKTKEREAFFIWPETEMQSDYYALISALDYRDIEFNEIMDIRVGLARDTAYAAMFRQWFPEHRASIEYETMDAAIRALRQGEVDMVMATQRRLLLLTHYQELPGYKANIVFEQPIKTIIGFNKNEAVLCSIIDKALNTIDTKAIADRWMRKTYDFQRKVIQMQVPWLIGSSLLFFIVLALVAVLFARSRRSEKLLEKIVNERTNDLKLQTSMLMTVFNSSPDFIFCKDLNLRYTQCNKGMRDYLNIKEEDVIGKSDMDVFGFSPDTAAGYIREDRKVINSKQPVIFEETIVTQSDGGKKSIIETIKTPLIQDGKVIGIMGISRDITKRKEMEEAALLATRTKSAFLANMSHEIRTPMNSIIGFSELALDSDASPKASEYLNKILENAKGLLLIINDILDISKVESGRMVLENIPFDMHELFNSCRALITPRAEEKNLMLHFYAEPSIGKRPLGDPTRLRQVLVNLLSNAVKFTNTGLVKLSSNLISKTNDKITMHFEVKDSGIGMTPEQIHRVFDPFTQAESETTRKYGGTGLGLSITKSIVELMGGELFVESAIGIGSKFSFDLTFETIDVSDESKPERKIIFDKFKKPAFDGEILLCEDNEMNQQVICEHLARVGLKTFVAENGKIGVDMVKNRKEHGEKQFDLILMDMHMPIMDGIEAATKILELNTGIPVVAMTANVMSNDLEIYKKRGMNDCVGKPFTSQELWSCLMKYLTPLNGEKPAKQKSAQLEEDPEFLKKVQMLFLRNNREKYEEITKALEANDIKLAHRLAHTLSSNAGQLGKTLLQQTAADIEKKLKDGTNQVTADQLKTLGKELNAVIAELKSLAD